VNSSVLGFTYFTYLLNFTAVQISKFNGRKSVKLSYVIKSQA